MIAKFQFIIIFVFIFPGFLTHLTAQNSFYDAKELEKAIKENNQPSIISILTKYTEKGTFTDIEEAKKIFKYNPFIYSQIKKISKPSARPLVPEVEKKKEEPIYEKPRKALSGILSPTAIVDTVSNFITKRFKEELITAFFSKFRERLTEKKALRLFFPSTSTFLLNSDSYDVQSFISLLREIFQNDLNNIGGNLGNFLKENETEIIDKESYLMVRISLHLIHSIKTGHLPIDVISGIDECSCIVETNSDFSNSMKLLALVSRNLRNKRGEGWIFPDEFNIMTLESNKSLRKLFIGLIYAKERKKFETLTFGTRHLKEILSEGDEEIIKKFHNYMYRILLEARTAQNHMEELKEKEKIENNEYFNYVKNVINILGSGLNTGRFTGLSGGERIRSLYLPVSKTVHEIYQNIHKGAYAVALMNALNIIKMLLHDSSVNRDIIRYGVFMIGMVNAKSSGEMLDVLETAALPVKGYRIKRNSPFSISVNSYAGLFLGGETLNPGERIIGNKTELCGAITAPIGIAFNLGTGRGYNEPGISWSLFLPVIDVGAIVSWRVTGHDKGLPELKWKNLLVPGIFIIHGLKKSPVSLGAGIQYGPQLREIDTENGVTINSNAFRFGLIFVVDIPIFNIFKTASSSSTRRSKRH
jgi:hypothetical protein